jgi:NAD(P)-dependent dehydrogenase (short-subunit alcohol dehydrogenase family)
MFFSLEGKVAVITGGSQGIGLTTAQRFKKAGAEIVVLDIADATEAAERLNGMAIQADVTDEASIQKAFASVVEKHGRIDVLVNNAGVGFDEPMLEEADFKLFDKVININVKGVMNCMKQVVAAYARRRRHLERIIDGRPGLTPDVECLQRFKSGCHQPDEECGGGVGVKAYSCELPGTRNRGDDDEHRNAE